MSPRLIGSNSFLAIGFVSMIVLLLASIVVWHQTLSKNTARLKIIAGEQLETTLITTMRDTTQRRAIALYRMNAMDDPFDRDEEFIRIRELGTEFLKARDQLFKRQMTDKEKQAWEHMRKIMNQGGMNQQKVLNLIQDEKIEDARLILIKDVVPIQDSFVEGITNILELQRASVERELEKASNHNEAAYKFIALLVTVALAMGVFMILVFRRTNKAEQELVKQGNRIRALYEVSSMSGMALDDQINKMLEIGCQLLNMECGRVTRLDRENNQITVVNIAGPNQYNDGVDNCYSIEDSICNLVIQENKSLALHNVKDPNIRGKHKALRTNDIQCYIAAPINVNNLVYGTVNFYSRTKRSSPFSETDKDLVNLIGSWVSVAIDRILQQQELRTARDAAESASQTKSAFLANMSHELRTPLNAIIGYSEILTEDAEHSGLNESLSDLEKINSSGHHLLSLIDDVLDLSKIEAGRMELFIEEFDIVPVIDNIAATLKPTITTNKNKLIVKMENSELWIRADKTKFKQVLFNLLSNANKFTKAGSINLTVASTGAGENRRISIEVKDTGIGMSPKQMDRLFEAFSQADPNIGRTYGGTGLGLAICKKICNMMDGEIIVDSVENIGTSFTVSFPGADKKRNAAVA